MSQTLALLPNEEVVTSSEKGVLTLTNKRVRYESVVWGQSNLLSITLGSVASCGLVTKSYPLLAILGGVACLGGLGGREMVPLLFLGAVLITIYFITRKSVISIASNGGEAILVPTKGMKREAIVAFIDAVEREKLK